MTLQNLFDQDHWYIAPVFTKVLYCWVGIGVEEADGRFGHGDASIVAHAFLEQHFCDIWHGKKSQCSLTVFSWEAKGRRDLGKQVIQGKTFFCFFIWSYSFSSSFICLIGEWMSWEQPCLIGWTTSSWRSTLYNLKRISVWLLEGQSYVCAWMCKKMTHKNICNLSIWSTWQRCI